MPRIAKNSLTISPLRDGRFYLSGSISAKTVRLKFADDPQTGEGGMELAEKKKTELERLDRNAVELEKTRPRQQFTRLTPEMLMRAEALFNEFSQYPLPVETYARAGLAALPASGPVKCFDAIREFEADMRQNQLATITLNENLRHAKRFAEFAGTEFVSDIKADDVHRYAHAAGRTGRKNPGEVQLYTVITRASRVRTFLNFCAKKKFIGAAPFEMDMDRLGEQAKKKKEKIRILTDEQPQGLLDAAIEHDPRFVPFIILGLWCFMRPAEVRGCLPSDIKLNVPRPFVEVCAHKNNSQVEREVRIPENMVGLLRECMECGLWPKGTTPFFSITAWGLVREKAGLFKPTEAKQGSVWQENILRHTGISFLYQLRDENGFQVTPIAEIAEQAGNSIKIIRKHYLNIPEVAWVTKFFSLHRKLNLAIVAKFTAGAKKVIAQQERVAVI